MFGLVSPRPERPGLEITVDPEGAVVIADALDILDPDSQAASAFSSMLAASIRNALVGEEEPQETE